MKTLLMRLLNQRLLNSDHLSWTQFLASSSYNMRKKTVCHFCTDFVNQETDMDSIDSVTSDITVAEAELAW